MKIRKAIKLINEQQKNMFIGRMHLTTDMFDRLLIEE